MKTYDHPLAQASHNNVEHHDNFASPAQLDHIETLDREGRHIIELNNTLNEPGIIADLYLGIPIEAQDNTPKANGSPLNKFEIVDIRDSNPIGNSGYKLYDNRVYPASAAILIRQPAMSDENKPGYFVLEEGQSFTFGRASDNTEMTDNFETSDTMSRQHAGIRLADGTLEVYDLGSTNRTTIVEKTRGTAVDNPTPGTERASFKAEFINFDDPDIAAALGNHHRREKSPATRSLERYIEHAKHVEVDELSRIKGNKGRPMDTEYHENYRTIRNYIVDHITNGDFYWPSDDFATHLKEIHRLADYQVYNRLNTRPDGSKGPQLYPEQVGVFHKNSPVASLVVDQKEFFEKGRLVNERVEKVLPIARHYNDPYIARESAASGQVFKPHLPNIAYKYLPSETVSQPNQAEINSVNIKWHTIGEFKYPSSESFDQYLEQIAHLGKSIEAQIKSENPDIDTAVDLIARQYQYGACMRPFAQINNSLFMEIANAQLKLLGLDGTTHGNMDLIAQRIQPDNFAQYFKDRLTGKID